MKSEYIDLCDNLGLVVMIKFGLLVSSWNSIQMNGCPFESYKTTFHAVITNAHSVDWVFFHINKAKNVWLFLSFVLALGNWNHDDKSVLTV